MTLRAKTPEAMTKLSPAGQHRNPTIKTPIGAFVPLAIGERSAVIKLTKGRYALIDIADWRRVAEYRWCATITRTGGMVYAKNADAGYLHRFIARVPADVMIDHEHGNGLDDRRSNLRICTNAQNSANKQKRSAGSSRFKGVHWNQKQRVWVASIHANYGCKFLGHFDSEDAAARRYDAAAREQYGEFARTNF